MVSRNLLLLDDDPVEPSLRLNILIVGQHQLDRRTVFKLRLDRKCQTQVTKPSFAKAFQNLQMVSEAILVQKPPRPPLQISRDRGEVAHW